MPPVTGPKMLTGDNDGPVAHWHYVYKNKRSLEASSPAKPEPDAENVGHGRYGFESKRAVPKDADADLDGSFRWRRSASEDVDAEGLDKRMRPVCTVKQQENNEC